MFLAKDDVLKNVKAYLATINSREKKGASVRQGQAE